jgi:hypothetical protein
MEAIAQEASAQVVSEPDLHRALALAVQIDESRGFESSEPIRHRVLVEVEPLADRSVAADPLVRESRQTGDHPRIDTEGDVVDSRVDDVHRDHGEGGKLSYPSGTVSLSSSVVFGRPWSPISGASPRRRGHVSPSPALGVG